MNISRPRHSVLNLFDPLLSSPPHDSLDADSDKENINPPSIASNDLSFSAYFNSSYKHAHPQQHVPKKRLVDIGDMTIDDASFHQMLTAGDDDEDDIEADFSQNLGPNVEDDEDETLTFKDMAKAATPNWKSRSTPASSVQSSPAYSRTPLGDLPLEQDSTPVARSRVYRKHPPVPIPSKFPRFDSELESPAHKREAVSSLDNVISAVNLSGISFADAKPLERVNEDSHPVGEEQGIISSPSSATNLTVHSSLNSLGNSVSTLQLPTFVDSLIAESGIPVLLSPPSPTSSETDMPSVSLPSDPAAQPRLRPNPPNTSSRASSRHSIDLHTSFQLQLQSSETTFDLLNDKVSFFNSRNGMDSFLNGLEEDDSFDMELEKENMEVVLKTIKKEEKSTGSLAASTAGVTPVVETASETDATEPAAPVDLDTGSITSPTFISAFGEKIIENKSVASPVFSKKPDALAAACSVFVPPVVTPPPCTPGNSRDASHLSQPPRIPALRIVKRIKALGHQKSYSTDRASSSGSSSVTVGATDSPNTHEPVVISRATSQPERRPSALAQASRPKANTVRIPASSAVPAHPSGVGARRVLVSEGPLAANTSIIERTSVASSGIGPRRVPVAPAPVANTKAQASSASKASAPAASGLRAPAKYGGTISSLPKPVAKSGISRLPTLGIRKVAGGDGVTTSRNVPVRRVV